MSLVTPTPPASRTESASATRAENARVPFKNSPWRPVVCCVGALGLGISLAPLFLKPQNMGTKNGSINDYTPAEIVLPSESTFVVAPTLPPGALLRGQIRLVADVIGKARVSGEVARHVVENGAYVKRGDAVVEISSGGKVRSIPRAEFGQNRAERGQIAAADAQTALAQKMGAAQTNLRDAQERVARSQAQVGTARDIVRRLQNGESVAPNEIPTSFRGQSVPADSIRPSKSRKQRFRRAIRFDARSEEGSNRIALRQAEAARSAARDSARDLQNAQKTLTAARSVAREADEKLQSATKGVADVEARFSAKKASGADVEAARAAQVEAQQAVNSADKALLSSKAEVIKREISAKSSQTYADSVAAQAAKSISDARLDLSTNDDSKAENAVESRAETPPEDPAATQRVTLDQAIRFASAALDESRRASRAAERIHAQIEGYQNQVTNSQSRVEAATQDLVSAQQKVLDSVPCPRFTASYAPSDGVVMWIARLAREVGEGQAVFGVARGEKVAAHFEDRSGLWRGLKQGATMPAFVVDNAGFNSAKEPASTLETKVTPVSTALGQPKSLVPSASYPVEVKITEIESPTDEKAPATLTAEVHSAQGAASTFKAGSAVLIPMPLPHQKATLSVPNSALVQRGAETYLAVLAPVEVRRPDAVDAEPKSVSTPKDAVVEPKFRLVWKLVKTGRSDGLRLEILSGLKEGERVVALPDQLEAMGFEPEFSIQARSESKAAATTNGAASKLLETASGTADATPQAESAAGTPAPSEVLVRLTLPLA